MMSCPLLVCGMIAEWTGWSGRSICSICGAWGLRERDAGGTGNGMYETVSDEPTDQSESGFVWSHGT